MLAKNGYGSFQNWVKSEIGISPRHANNLLQIEKFYSYWELVPNKKENFESLSVRSQLLVSNSNTLPKVKELALSGEVTRFA